MPRIRFTIPSAATPKARARTFPKTKDGKILFRNGKPVMRSITPEKTKAWEHFVSLISRQAAVKHGLREPIPLGTPIMLGCVFYMTIPTSWSQKKKQEAREGKIRHTSKPDLSNLLKAIEDGAENVLWTNDSQIVCYGMVDNTVATQKCYGDDPRTEVEFAWGEDFYLTTPPS